MKLLLPKLSQSSYKGQNGRLAVIGGCLEYTGAPFYSSISQLKGGSDLAHIFCTKQAATPIKSYSPEVITHPYLHSSNEEDENISSEEMKCKINKTLQQIAEWQGALHSFVIGPGLGRDKWILSYLGDLIGSFTKNQIIVVDADGLWYVMTQYANEKEKSTIFHNLILSNPQYHVLTPNQPEFERLWNCFMGEEKMILTSSKKLEMALKLSQEYEIRNREETLKLKLQGTQNESDVVQYIEIKDLTNELVADVVRLSNRLNNVNIVVKGFVDVISNGKQAFIVVQQSSPKRCGGVGDVLSGLTGLYCFWAQKSAAEQINEHHQTQPSIIMGIVLASCITRKSSFLAFQQHKFSLTAPNVIEFIGTSFWTVYSHFYAQELSKL